MELNQSPLSGFKTSNSNTGTERADANTSSQITKVRDARNIMPNQQPPRMDMKEGQIVSGEIVDRRYNEVSIQIEPGKQMITAKLAGDVPLSIGQNAEFQVADNSSGLLTLKYIPAEVSSTTDTLIQKALLASSLPLTEINKAFVEELLNNSMSIDKQTLQLLAKQSHMNRDASTTTLVLMLKNKLPLTPENVRQFEAYRNNSGKLMDDLHVVTKALLDSVKQFNLPATIEKAPELGSSIIDILTGNSAQTNEVATTGIPLQEFLNRDELELLSKSIGTKLSDSNEIPDSISPNLLKRIYSGTASAEDAMKLITQLFSSDAEDAQPRNEKFSLIPAEGETSIQKTMAPIIDKIVKNLNPNPSSGPAIGDLLNPAEREELLKLLNPSAGKESFVLQMKDGSASLKELFGVLKETISVPNQPFASELLGTPVYQKLMEEALRQKWTLTPEKLKDKSNVVKLFNNLTADMEKLRDVLNLGKESVETLRTQSQDSVANLQENLKFMKDLNEVFTFLPLPVQLKNQEVQSDLYVFTKKNALKGKQEALSVLLHLDMANLGPLNVHIQMKQKQINAAFYLEDTEASSIIASNLPVLEDALKNKGYVLYAKIESTYEKPDFCKDFIEQNSQDNDIKRYSFDVRT